jgi:hypothetical protein
MNVRHLIHELQQLDGDLEVRIAMQPAWPFEHSIEAVVHGKGDSAVEDGWEALRDDDGWHVEHDGDQVAGPFDTDFEAQGVAVELWEEEQAKHGDVVYLAEGEQIGYLPAAAAKRLGWRSAV